MTDQEAREGLLRGLLFYSVLSYPPTRVEWLSAWHAAGGSSPDGSFSRKDVETAARALIYSGEVVERGGRVACAQEATLFALHEERERLFPRKIRTARRAARWLARQDGVRFVALCNTTALAHARDEGDLDFFIITRAGSLWQTRGWSTLPFRVLRRRPHESEGEKDAVCLSFFVDDSALDLSVLQLPGQDVYFHYWFHSMLPLYDDGVSRELWQANSALQVSYPLAAPWIVAPDLEVKRPSIRIPFTPWLESYAATLQKSFMPAELTQMMNKDSRVVVHDHVLKFHAEDGRERMRQSYEERCAAYGLLP